MSITSSSTSGRAGSLNSKNSKAQYDHQKTQEACDTYTDGVFAVLALVNEARWDPAARELRPEVRYELGRRLTTSALNRVTPQVAVTPDCVVQFDATTGLVSEAKLGLPMDQTAWDDDITQIQKYDDDLTGWWTPQETIDRHDIVALVPLTRAVQFADRLDAGSAAGKWSFQRPLAVVGFFKTSGVRDFLTLKKERGGLTTKDLDERLRVSKAVNTDHLLVGYRDRKFVDHRPPLPYLLQIMWDCLFTGYAAEAVNSGPSEPVVLSVTVDKVTEELQEYYGSRSAGPRSPEIPRAKWVRAALDALVTFKMAKKEGDGGYVIKYKRTRRDTLEKFGRLNFRLEQKRKSRSDDGTPLLPGLLT